MSLFNLGYSMSFFALISVSSAAASPKSVEAILHDASGKNIGKAKLTQLKQGVRIELMAQGLPEGVLAFHVHETGKCVGPDFKSAGDHFAPSGEKHGFDAAHGPHAGDMPNLVVKSDGKAHIEVINSKVTLGKGKNSLLKPGGTALVIHAGVDDFKSQPSGNAGDRIACAEISPI